MPELPEVEVVRSGLEPVVTGATIVGVEILDARSTKRHLPGSGDFTGLLVGRTILGAARRGKFLWLPLGPRPDASSEDVPRALLVHLGMSGQVLVRTADHDLDRLLRIRVELAHPELGELFLHFVDQRIFGSMAVDELRPTVDGLAAGYAGRAAAEAVPTPGWLALLPGQVAHIARDPLDPAFDDERFIRAVRSRSSAVKRLLLDQNLVSGIGNIYADESLWASELHYDQPGSSITEPALRRLLAEVRTVLERALAEGGTSFDAQYVNVNGASGYFSHSLRAYGQQGRPCERCGETIVREAFMNRSSHVCPRCQVLRPV